MHSTQSNQKRKFNTATPVPKADWSFEAIGTKWWVGVYQPIDSAELQAVQLAVAERIERFDQTYSRFRSDSLVSRVAQSAGSYQFPADADALFRYYRSLYDLTAGAVTPLIGQMLSDAGYDANYSFQPKPLTEPPLWGSVMTYCGGQLTTNQPVLLDFGAAGKGYLVDLTVQLLRDRGLSDFCVDAGGDMFCSGDSLRLQVGLEHPFNPLQAIGIVPLQSKALCGSASNRRAWKQYHHTMDPFNKNSPNQYAAIWVMAESTMLADGLTTALHFVSPEALQKTYAFDYILITNDSAAKYSSGFANALFSHEEA